MKLIASGYDVYGVDASESGISLARAQYPDAFFLMDVQASRLPVQLRDKQFTTVISRKSVV